MEGKVEDQSLHESEDSDGNGTLHYIVNWIERRVFQPAVKIQRETKLRQIHQYLV
ncbi:hypothetical protein LOK49_LG03G03297 [Camellia lanceoleosa]|uniref:Uncharacterized protein n=1 Tax=Camellia lanceoleosa TaxID=1840588 RepID=A0ACC0IH18_9ERIC|nr:hypothetical protein LOK49_LG03G03297 [Camellia lanceoleosa]